MTRVKISAAILTALAVLSIMSGIWVRSRCGRIIREARSVGDLYYDGEREEALEAAHLLELDWSDFRKKASFIIRHDTLSEIDRSCSQLVLLVEKGSTDLEPELTMFESRIRETKR